MKKVTEENTSCICLILVEGILHYLRHLKSVQKYMNCKVEGWGSGGHSNFQKNTIHLKTLPKNLNT